MIDFEKFSKLVVKTEELKAINKLIRLGYISLVDLTGPKVLSNIQITLNGSLFLLNQRQTEDLSWVTTEYRKKFKDKNLSKFGDKKATESKMLVFMNEHQATKEEILQATDLYLETITDYSNNQMSRADYFISFDNGKREVISKLSQYLELIRDGQKSNDSVKWI